MAAFSAQENSKALHQKYNQLNSEIAELQVVNSELETLRPKSKVYLKQGNIFFMADRTETSSDYKRKLAEKIKEREEIKRKWK